MPQATAQPRKRDVLKRRKTDRNNTPENRPDKLTDTADIVPQRALPLFDALLIQLFIGIGVTIALLIHQPGWYGVAAGLVVALLFVVRVRGHTLPSWIAVRASFSKERWRRAKSAEQFEPFDADLGEGAQIGFHWDGKTLLSLLRIQENPQAMTVLEPGVTISGEMVSIQAVADCLQQFDITLDSIDVISQGSRSQGRGHIASIYDAVIGPLPAIAQRTVWVAVRFDPTLCPDAVRTRGGGQEGITRTAATATRRVANRLAEAGLRPHIMTASEIAHATNQLCDGVALPSLEETWFTCQDGLFQLRSFSVKPSMFSTAGLGLLWTIPSYSTTVCISLRRDPSKRAPKGAIKIRGLARFDSHGRTRVRLRGVSPLRGYQFSALLSTLPLPAPRRSIERWVFGMTGNALADLAIPASGCGQVIGADEHGRAVALPLFGPQIERVEICGTLHLAQQAVLRSLALGARVRVHTRRPAAWREMVEEVDDSNLLRVTDFNRSTMQAGSDRNYSVEMFDGVSEQGVRVGVTAIVVKPPQARPSGNADVTLQLIDPINDVVRVGTRSGAAVVTMVATDDEMRYIKSSFDSPD
ncbi:type VII secretion protein EccE [Mycolicibacterium fortuitum]|uniref:Type VII secretion protein EccE n=1 Tax=Mycolicibacterium fortuitum TaxID=1766 RepID=A0A378WFI8_MYCFO|nr:type VII secretion protein EccE [Mycolicibacterium fortuitum]